MDDNGGEMTRSPPDGVGGERTKETGQGQDRSAGSRTQALCSECSAVQWLRRATGPE